MSEQLAAINKRANNYNLRNPKQSLQQQAASSNQNILDGAAGKSGRKNSFKVLNEMMCIKQDNTSIKKEFPEKYSWWWLNELDSLGLAVKKANDLNDIREVSSLADNIKQVLFQDYKTRFNQETEDIVI